MNLRRILSQAALVVGAVVFSIGLQTFAAFTQPTNAPPNADTYAPLTTSPTAEAKSGGLLLNTGGAANGLIVQSGNVGIGVGSPSQMLDVAGYMKASGVCIGSDCRTAWPTSGGLTGTWHNLTGSRNFNTTYTNSTGKTMIVGATSNGQSNIYPEITAYVDGMIVGGSTTGPNVGASPHAAITGIVVPAGSTYQISTTVTTGVASWAEFY